MSTIDTAEIAESAKKYSSEMSYTGSMSYMSEDFQGYTS